jgi:phenylalanyl-tRNA synthetase beta chain
MKISYQWLREYIDTTYDVKEISDVLTSIGLEVESVETVESVPGGLKGVVVGEVLTCEKHPDADRLRITTVNLGEGEPVQIVCGAPNVAAGQKVLVATIGTKLFPSEGEPLVIKKGKIRGQDSLGMICAEDELGLGKSHDGIKILSEDAIPGTAAAAFLNLSEDHCIEIGLTPNRTDAFSHFGVARDLYVAVRNMVGVRQDAPVLKLPKLAELKFSEGEKGIDVSVLDTEACPRYCGLTISNIKVEDSPEWLRKKLAVIGVRSISNIVDITNYVQHEIGQPLHAFDLQKIEGNKVIVRKASEGEKFVTLEGTARELSSMDLMICDANKPMCIAGVFGGLESGVSEKTTSIFLESAFFNPVSVRKTAKRHGLHTDASFRFERGCDPSIAPWALQRAALLICEIAGGVIHGSMFDFYPTEITKHTIDFDLDRAELLIGKNIGKEKIKSILHDLEITILEENASGLSLSVPHYRNDVQRESDIVEEILRIYGYDNIEIPARMKTSISFSPKPDPEKAQTKTSDMLTSNGFSEMMAMSLTKTKYREFSETESQKNSAVELLNPLSGDLGMMRQSLLFGGLESIHLNRNHRSFDLRLYEFGKTYAKYQQKYHEERHLSIFMTGSRVVESWNNTSAQVSFAELKGIVENVFRCLSLKITSSASASHSHFEECIELKVGKTVVATLGSVNGDVLNAFDISQPVWYADVKWEQVLSLLPLTKTSYRESDKFPAVRRDLSLLLQKETHYAEIERLAFETDKKYLREVNLFDVYEGKNLAEGKKSYAVSFVLQDSSKTMTDQQVDQVIGRIQKTLEEKLGATLRGV